MNENEQRLFSISEAKLWIDSNYQGGLIMKSGDKDKKKYYLTKKWDKAKKFKNDKVEVVEVPLDSDEKFGFITAEAEKLARNTGVLEYVLSETRLLIQKNKKTGVINAHFMTIIGDPEYLDKTDFKVDKNTYLKKEKDFSGIILFHELNGIFNIGWKYTDGKLTHRITSNLLLDSGLRLKEALVEADCYQIQLYEIITHWHFNGDLEIIIDRVETNIIYEYIQCYYYGEDDGIIGGGGAPSSTDADDTQPVQDCNCETCPICGGCVAIATLKGALLPDDDGTSGTTTTTNESATPCPMCSCPVVDITGLEQNSKADCIYQKLIQGKILQDFINRYFAPSQATQSVLGELNLTWTLGTTTETLPIGIPRNNTYYSVEIRLNETALNANSSTNVALSMLHEALHAKLIAEVYDEVQSTDFKTLFAYYKGWGFNSLDNQQEYEMMTTYADRMAQALQEFDQTQGINHPLDFYKEALKYTFTDDLGLPIYTSGQDEYLILFESIKTCN